MNNENTRRELCSRHMPDVYSSSEVALSNNDRWVRLEDYEFAVAQIASALARAPAEGDSAESLRGLAEALTLPDGYEVTEFLPGQWSYEYDRADGERMACGTNWIHPALAACAAWESYADGLSRPAASARVPDDRVQYIIGKLQAHAAKADARRRGYSDGVPSHTAMLVSETVELIRKLAASPTLPAVDGDDSERCESGDPACGPVEFHDSEGVPLCAVCWEGLLADSAALAQQAGSDDGEGAIG